MRTLLAFPLVLGCAAAGDASPPSSPPRAADEAPLVVELFTSQGCSSCPPADALLGELAKAGALAGRKLAPLAFHVDYWNQLGWADPFATAAWTARQQDYARALGDRVYTPELVVGGGVGVVGSQADRVARAIAAAPRQRAIAATATWRAHELVVEATAPEGADVFVAVWEDGTRTNVLRGENAGETLPGERVVRELRRVAEAGHAGRVEISLGAFRASGAVAFAQQRDLRIVGSTLLPR